MFRNKLSHLIILVSIGSDAEDIEFRIKSKRLDSLRAKTTFIKLKIGQTLQCRILYPRL